MLVVQGVLVAQAGYVLGSRERGVQLAQAG